MNRNLLVWAALGVAAGMTLALPGSAALILNQPFNTDTATTPTTLATYPEFTKTGPPAVDFLVVGGVLNMYRLGDTTTSAFILTNTYPSGTDWHVSLQVGASATGNLDGLFIGNGTPDFLTEYLSPGGSLNNFVSFQPGQSGGLLRVWGPGDTGYINTGFDPALNVLHTLNVDTDGFGNFSVRLIDGSNPLNQYTTSWSNPFLSTFQLGLMTYGFTGSHVISFDNLNVIPEPSTAVLLSLGALVCWRRREKW
jgi:hypothetical protein